MQAVEYLKNWWKNASSVARAVAVTGALMVLLTSAYFGSKDPTHHWVPLNDAPLSFADAGRLTQTLASMNVPYRTEADDGGQAVLVPFERAAELQMTLAVDGVAPGQSSNPYDSMWRDGAPAFQTAGMERAMRAHAKEKSIEHKLATLRPIKRAMVDLALPENTILSHTDHKATASVVIELEPRYQFTRELADSIRTTVAHAVEGLTMESVAVTDHLGRRVGPAIGDAATALASRTLALRQEHESSYEERIVQLLEPIVGRGRIVARVSAQMDMSRTDQRSEEFDADNAVVRRERKSTDNALTEQNDPKVGAGVGANAPQRPAGANPTPTSKTQNDNSISETDYAVPRKVVETSRPMGTIQRLSVAVVVDSGDETESAPDAPDGDPTVEAASDVEVSGKRTIPSKRALAEIIKKAVGFDPVRGDSIEVLYTPFERPKFLGTLAPPEVSVADSLPPWVPYTTILALGFALMLGSVSLSERRKRRDAAKEAKLAKEKEEFAQKKVEEEQEAAAIAKTLGNGQMKEEVREIARTQTAATIQLLKDWLAAPAQASKK